MTGGRRTLDDINVAGKHVLLRVDFNVPIADGAVVDDTRIRATLPTVRELSARGGKVIIISHMGRPRDGYDPTLSLTQVRPALTALLGKPVAFIPDCVGDQACRTVAAMKNGDVVLLENLRFHAGEAGNREDFACGLAKLGDVFVNDAFSAAHLCHASTVRLAECLPAASGRAFEAELSSLSGVLDAPDRPLTAVIGGAKVSTKLALLDHLCVLCDTMIIGGAMANTFLAARGIDVAASLYEPELTNVAGDILARGAAENCRILLPVDAVAARAVCSDAACRVIAIDDLADGEMILDIGPQSLRRAEDALNQTRVLLWNGPLGAFETPPFDQGTMALARHAAQLTGQGKLTSIVGGGDTLAALNRARLSDLFSHVSMAGGAFLQWLEGRPLPGVAALERAGR